MSARGEITIRPIQPADDAAIAARDASVARSRARRPADARVRVSMPVRWRIHSSLLSIGPTRSSFGTTRSPRADPNERMREPTGPVGWRSDGGD